MKFSTIRNSKWFRHLCAFTAVTMVGQVVMPTAALALTSGPAQPEFSSFEPVATTSMVNDFTGDFTYNLPVLNIPGANGGGYSMSLSYHSGVNPEEEASWVGYGWTLNPGAINRSKRGFPDDWNNTNVKYWNQTRPNETVSVGGATTLEVFSHSPLSINGAIRYNNYQGFGYNYGLGLTMGSAVTLGYNVDNGQGSFSLDVNPMKALTKSKDDNQDQDNDQKANSTKPEPEGEQSTDASSQVAETEAAESGQTHDPNGGWSNGGLGNFSLVGSNYGMFSYGEITRAMNVSGYEGIHTKFKMSVLPTPTGTSRWRLRFVWHLQPPNQLATCGQRRFGRLRLHVFQRRPGHTGRHYGLLHGKGHHLPKAR